VDSAAIDGRKAGERQLLVTNTCAAHTAAVAAAAAAKSGEVARVQKPASRALGCSPQVVVHRYCNTSLLCCCCCCIAGAVVLSNGNARIGAITSNTSPTRTQSQGTGPATDPDLQALSTAAGYGSQTLFDQVLLTFDMTPTASGNLAFQYVFGSEEYPDFAPSLGENI
jgi:hypothetical protein